MNKYTLYLILFCYSIPVNAQTEIFTGTIPSKSEFSIFNKIAVSDEHYYFAAWNIEGNERTVSIFQTTHDFVFVRSIENLKIREIDIAYTTYLEVENDKLMMISSARVDNSERLYSHSLDLDLNNHTIIDSLDYIEGEEFIANQFKALNNGNIYAFGEISQNNIGNRLSANYIEFTNEGNIIKFENVDIPTLLITAFDYNPNLNRYIVRDFTNTYLLDSSFSVVSNLNLNITSSSTIAQFLAGYCSFASDSLIQSIGSNPGADADNFSNFVAELGLSGDSLFYSSAIPLHPADLGNERTSLIYTSIDTNGNYYFSYHEPFISFDGNVMPNKIFISKYDKDFQELFFIELNSSDEFFISENILDKDNNLIIIGGVITNEAPNEAQNFFIKVSESGEVLTNTRQPIISKELNLFPNPCKDYITVSGFENFVESEYNIYTLDGKLISKGILSNNEIPTANFPTGMYLLNVLNEDGIYVGKFVKR